MICLDQKVCLDQKICFMDYTHSYICNYIYTLLQIMNGTNKIMNK